MNSQSNSPRSSRPIPILNDREAPNFDPIRDDPEPMLEPTLGPPRKRPSQVDENSGRSTEKVVKETSNNLKPVDVSTNANAATAGSLQETTKLKIAREKALEHKHDLRDF